MTDDDEEAIQGFVAGDERAFTRLVTLHKAALHRFIYRYVHDSVEAEALLFDCFVRAWKNRGSYQHTARFQTWLFSIATNLCRDHARTRHRRPGDFARDSVSFSPDRDGALTDSDPSSEAVSHEDIARLQAEMDRLPHEQKAALMLFALEGKSHEEVAVILGCTVKAVETRIYHARRELRRRWDAE